jgi:hypothetical protein
MKPMLNLSLLRLMFPGCQTQTPTYLENQTSELYRAEGQSELLRMVLN